MRWELWRSAKSRAASQRIPFDLNLVDITVPERCPILGFQLHPSSGKKAAPHSPSLDRIIPSIGYVRGNVTVISQRANVLKNNATVEELRAVLKYMEESLDRRD